MRSILKIGILLCWAGTALAQANDARFDAAVHGWLAGDDKRSLTVFSELAAQGHRDARIVVTRILLADRGYSSFLQTLTRHERNALFRQANSGRLGKSWLAVAAEEGDELADALMRAQLPDPDAALIESLAALGEHQATDHPTRILALYGDSTDRARLQASGAALRELQPYLNYTHWRAGISWRWPCGAAPHHAGPYDNGRSKGCAGNGRPARTGVPLWRNGSGKRISWPRRNMADERARDPTHPRYLHQRLPGRAPLQ